MKKLNFYLLMIAFIIERALSTPNCMELMTRNSFGLSLISSSSCFTQSIEGLKEMIVFYTSTDIAGISFGLINGQNLSYIENMGFTNSERINLTNSYLTGVEIWVGDYGISGLKFHTYSQDTSSFIFTSLMGPTIGCYFYLNSTFMKSNYFKIKTIGGCVDSSNSNKIPTINFQYSFSQCPLYLLPNTTSTAKNLTTFTDDSCIAKSKFFSLECAMS